MNADTILHRVIDIINTTGVPDEYFDIYCQLAEKSLSTINDQSNVEAHYNHCAFVARLLLTLGLDLVATTEQPKEKPLFLLN
jgi:hypothetical protein